MSNPALLLVSARPAYLSAALPLLVARHGRVLLVAPDHVALPEELGHPVLRFRNSRFGIPAGLRILASLGARWDDAYFLAPDASGTGMQNVIAAAAVACRRVHCVAPAGVEKGIEPILVEVAVAGAFVAECGNLGAAVATAASVVPPWVLSSAALIATARNVISGDLEDS